MEAYELGGHAVEDLARHPDSPEHRAMLQTLMWVGGLAAGEAGVGERRGYPVSQGTEFIQGFMTALRKIATAYEAENE